MARYRKTRKCVRGGSATSLPLKYFNTNAPQQFITSGTDILKASGNIIRPIIGGTRRITRKIGGFVPSVMGGFTNLASKYITPIALFTGYKLLNRTLKNKSNRKRVTRKH